ncbi:hypothetical protein [Longimicrobium sp.]|uniref:hypothetical protein n=1 Tax=Longimicrobium sp. TaxID=2029185 RepID=UPI003B3A5770
MMKCKAVRAAILGLLMTLAGAMPLAAQAGAEPGVDWARVTERDLNVASVFLTARDRGPRAALDSLERLAARDPSIRGKGHQLAHAVGRYAMEQRKDLAVLAGCTPRFQSGCFHGVLEGYFLQGGSIDRASVGNVCTGQQVARGFERMECWHGLGHGLMVHHAGNFRQALDVCDGLQADQPRRECQDGIFMERAIRAIGATSINVGGGPGIGHAHGAEGHQDHAAARTLSAADKQDGAGRAMAKVGARREREQLCSGVDAGHQRSCWAYQSMVLMSMSWPNYPRALRGCDTAPADAVRDCYQGFGKQMLGVSFGDVGKMMEACRQGDPARVTDCLMGGVEYFTDLDWRIEPGIDFCRQVPGESKPRCYEMIGARLTLAHTDPEPVRAACRQVEAAYVRACLAGAGMQER